MWMKYERARGENFLINHPLIPIQIYVHVYLPKKCDVCFRLLNGSDNLKIVWYGSKRHEREEKVVFWKNTILVLFE